MPVYKENNNKTWYVSVRYEDWTGKKSRKVKRGFETKREAAEWERRFLLKENSSLDKADECNQKFGDGGDQSRFDLRINRRTAAGKNPYRQV